jgi:hypothetical protein
MACCALGLTLALSALPAHAQITDANSLQKALDSLKSGQTLELPAGTFTRVGGFRLNAGISGTASAPIILRGHPSGTVLSSGNLNSGTALKLLGQNDHVHIVGLEVRTSQKGIEVYDSKAVRIDSVRASNFGQEALHLLQFTQNSVIQNSWIDSTGMISPQYGEGIYIGSAESNWTSKSFGKPDSSDNNRILNNRFGDVITAENIDIKEGTRGGWIEGNQFNGKGLANQNSADSWIDLKGNTYTVLRNTGVDSYLDGFQTHINFAGYGDSNIIAWNTLDVGSSGYGINVQTSGSRGTAPNNIVCDNNTVTGAGAGVTNVPVQTCANLTALKATHKSQAASRLNGLEGLSLVVLDGWTRLGSEIWDAQGRNQVVKPGGPWPQLSAGRYVVRSQERTWIYLVSEAVP